MLRVGLKEVHVGAIQSRFEACKWNGVVIQGELSTQLLNKMKEMSLKGSYCIIVLDGTRCLSQQSDANYTCTHYKYDVLK